MRIQLWKFSANEGHKAHKMQAFEGNRPVVLYLGGTGDFDQDAPNESIGKWLQDLLDPSAMATPLPGNAQNVDTIPEADLYTVTGEYGQNYDLSNLILPQIPDSFEELQRILSRFTFVTFSHGTEYVNGAHGNLPISIATRLYNSGKFTETQISTALNSMCAIELAPDNISSELSSDERLANKNTIPSMATFMMNDQMIHLRTNGAERQPAVGVPDGALIGYHYAPDNNRLMIAGRVYEGTGALPSSAMKLGRLHNTEREIVDHHHPYYETNSTGFNPANQHLTYQVAPYAHIVRHLLQRMVHASGEAIIQNKPRDAAHIIRDVTEDMLSESAIQDIGVYLEDSRRLFDAHSQYTGRTR